MSNLEKYRGDLQRLLDLGSRMMLDLTSRHEATSIPLTAEQKETAKKLKGTFEGEYQRWYSESMAIVRQLLPRRLAEFEGLYRGDKKRKGIDVVTYTIQDWLLGIRAAPNQHNGEKLFDDFGAVVMRFTTQYDILTSIESRFESSLFEIAQLARADLFDSELDAARALLKSGFVRAAGVVAGVVLEKHLLGVCASHGIGLRKKNPTISDLNDLLKETGVVDIPVWRQIQRLGDLRNQCAHQKEREPSKDEAAELLEGCAKMSKTVH
jgi:hypothetical protein